MMHSCAQVAFPVIDVQCRKQAVEVTQKLSRHRKKKIRSRTDCFTLQLINRNHTTIWQMLVRRLQMCAICSLQIMTCKECSRHGRRDSPRNSKMSLPPLYRKRAAGLGHRRPQPKLSPRRPQHPIANRFIPTASNTAGPHLTARHLQSPQNARCITGQQ